MNVNPRKFPSQARAQATVEAIIVATAQLLAEQGFENLTTAAVAERAGVSIGSLYQYFPNKRALAAAAVDHYGDALAVSFDEAWHSHETLRDAVDAMIDAALVAHPHKPELHRALNELAPRVERAEKTREISARVMKIIQAVLEQHRNEIAADLDLGAAAALIETVLEAVSHRAIEHHPVNLTNEQMRSQCRRLIMAYLRAPVLE